MIRYRSGKYVRVASEVRVVTVIHTQQQQLVHELLGLSLHHVVYDYLANVSPILFEIFILFVVLVVFVFKSGLVFSLFTGRLWLNELQGLVTNKEVSVG